MSIAPIAGSRYLLIRQLTGNAIVLPAEDLDAH